MVETPIGKAPAARFEISIDGVPRSHRDQRDMAIEAAAQLMLKYPNSVVAVKDLQSGERVAAEYKLDLGRR
jgi:electron transfer flavoprotein alpha/beta subunit